MNSWKAGVGRPVVVAAYAALTAIASNALAAEDGEQRWQFEFTPYLFAAGLKGTSGTQGVTADIDVPFDKVFDHLDGAFMGVFEARTGNWAFGFDGLYVRLEGERSRSWQGPAGIGSATGELDVAIKQQVYTPYAGYRVVDGRTTVYVIGAARYTQLDTELNLVTTTGGLLPGGTRTQNGSKSWWDPVVGASIAVPFAEHWSAVGYVDVGGFGVGSDLTYQAIAGANWQFAKNFSAKAGYRYLYQDFEEDGFVWDMALHGVYLGLGIRF
jgi:opacity protein-like surface antigen